MSTMPISPSFNIKPCSDVYTTDFVKVCPHCNKDYRIRLSNEVYDSMGNSAISKEAELQLDERIRNCECRTNVHFNGTTVFNNDAGYAAIGPRGAGGAGGSMSVPVNPNCHNNIINSTSTVAQIRSELGIINDGLYSTFTADPEWREQRLKAERGETKGFEPYKTAKELGIDTTQSFRVINGDDYFNKGDIVKFVKDIEDGDQELAQFKRLGDGYISFFYWEDLAYAGVSVKNGSAHVKVEPTLSKMDKMVKVLDTPLVNLDDKLQ